MRDIPTASIILETSYGGLDNRQLAQIRVIHDPGGQTACELTIEDEIVWNGVASFVWYVAGSRCRRQW